MTAPARSIRLGVLIESGSCPAWQLAVLRGLLSVEGVELALVVDGGAARPAPLAPSARLPRDPARSVSPAAELDGVRRIPLAEANQRVIEGYSLDVIWSALAAAPPHLARAARAGTWWLEIDGGDSGCTRALLHAAPQVKARLLRLASEPGRARVLAEPSFKNEPFAPALTRARVLYGAAAWPARQLRRWLLQGDTALDGELVPLGAASPPGRLARVALPARRLASLGRRGLRSCYRDQWAVGVLRQPIEALLRDDRLPETHWLETGGGAEFHADPFGLQMKSELVLLAEGYRRDRKLGRIDALRVGDDGSTEIIAQDVVPAAGHLSYPYLVRHEGEVYCIPETCAQRRVTLYRADPFPHRWAPAATLLDDFAGVDSTVFRHDGRWWLLCTNQDDGPYEKLFGFYAETLTGPWRPHPLNPLKCDPRSARPGGTPFRHAGALYRPAQDCSVDYGGAIVINRVDALAPDAFAEVPVKRIEPDARGPYPHGLHTVAHVGQYTVIDGNRLVFSPPAALRAARHFFGRLRAR